jgi:hypothetical protein
LVSCGMVVVLAYGSIALASSRTGGVAAPQFLALVLGVPLSVIVISVLGFAGALDLRSASVVVGIFAAIFLAGALAHTRYGREQTLHSAGLDVRIEREYGDPFDYFVARWRTPGSAWSERQSIGDDMRHKPPFKLEDRGNGVYLIRDNTGAMEERIGPEVWEKKGEPDGAGNSHRAGQ